MTNLAHKINRRVIRIEIENSVTWDRREIITKVLDVSIIYMGITQVRDLVMGKLLFQIGYMLLGSIRL